MTVVVLAAKALLAVMLLVAGGAKLAGLEAFAATVMLLAPRRLPLPGSKDGARRVAGAVALGEIALGSASLAVPAAGWLNLAVLAAAASFLAVSAAGFAFHRGRSCRCFGALSQRRFDRAGLARSAAVAGLAGLATVAVPPAAVALPSASHALLLAGSALIAYVACTAARSLAVSRAAQPGMVP